ncbi:response regulator [Acetobacteraceae bacterium H6797]|nr:response regulator [Acetobacteraceae bacterium H6797]
MSEGFFAGLRRSRSAANEAMYQAAFMAQPEAAALLDRQGLLRMANPALHRLCAPTPVPEPGEPLALLFSPEAREAFAELVERPDMAAGPLPFPLAGPGPAGPMLAQLLPVSEGLLMLRLARPEPQPEASEDAERLQALGELAGGIAHDFNNLLTGILGAVAAARDGSGEIATELTQVEAGARRGAALVAQLLAFARRQRLEPRVIAINSAVEHIGELLRRVLGRRIELTIALDEPGRCVRIDPAKLDQVIVNLAINARDAMPQGGCLSLTTAHATVLRTEMVSGVAIPPGRWVTLEVADTGQGIPPEVLSRIFEPFFTTKRDRGGTGLGLASVLGIVRQSGGVMTVQSEPGQGTRMTLWLPRHPGPPDPEPGTVAVPPGALGRATAEADSTAPILLIDDEAPLLRLAIRSLGQLGRPVEGAEDAMEALDAIDAGLRPAILVSDVSMPGMDGLSLVRAARERLPGLRALLVSGYAEATLDADLSAEGIAFLAKPFAPAELVAAVKAALER